MRRRCGAIRFACFTSLLRPELIADTALRGQALSILRRRRIFTPKCLGLIAQFERDGGLSTADAKAFIDEALETFRWHSEATVDFETYRRLRETHSLAADVVCFRGPHINHLTPRTLDIDRVQQRMPSVGIQPKQTIEGPPRRRVPILLRQTSFLALSEPVRFPGQTAVDGTHTARFGEIEQRGCALTPKGRELYDRLLGAARAQAAAGQPMAEAVAQAFAAFPDDLTVLHRDGLAFVRYVAKQDRPRALPVPEGAPIAELIDGGWLRIEPLVYEDFLPVSAAGIFRSNLGSEVREAYDLPSQQQAFEEALGAPVADEMALYAAAQEASLAAALRTLAPVPEQAGAGAA